MNILLLGSGGREHALAWKISQSTLCEKLYIAPGNAGTLKHGTNIDLSLSNFTAIKEFCRKEKIELVIVGPEDPLVAGIYDSFKNDAGSNHIVVIGPSAAAAQLEGSKAFSKMFMQKYNIPTAAYAQFDDASFAEGIQYLRRHSLPIVLKADGLAAGKVVVIVDTIEEAENAFTKMIREKQFGEASARVVVEQFLEGIEVSVFVLTNGVDYKIIGHAKDYKRIGEGDTGLNTGGMGCVSPVPFVDDIFMKQVEEQIIRPTIFGLQQENLEYKGFVFFGLIKVGNEPFVIEYNCRLGDPETEVVMPRLQNDLVDLLMSVHSELFMQQEIEIDERACCTVVAVSGGYPGHYQKGYPIEGLQKLHQDDLMFHAGTIIKENKVVTNGGRVLASTAYGQTINQAVQIAQSSLERISYTDKYYRKDIGYEFD